MNSYTIRRLLILIIISVFIGVVPGVILNILRSYQTVQVNIASDVKIVRVYRDTLGEINQSGNANKPVALISKSGKLRLKDGVYDFKVSDPTNQFSNPVIKEQINDLTGSIDINPVFSQSRLTAMLQTDRLNIQNYILSQYPYLPYYYTFGNDQLYEKGDWYGVRLIPLANSQADSLVLILHNISGIWSVAAPPQINIGIPSYGSIPSLIIDSVDQL